MARTATEILRQMREKEAGGAAVQSQSAMGQGRTASQYLTRQQAAGRGLEGLYQDTDDFLMQAAYEATSRRSTYQDAASMADYAGAQEKRRNELLDGITQSRGQYAQNSGALDALTQMEKALYDERRGLFDERRQREQLGGADEFETVMREYAEQAAQRQRQAAEKERIETLDPQQADLLVRSRERRLAQLKAEKPATERETADRHWQAYQAAQTPEAREKAEKEGWAQMGAIDERIAHTQKALEGYRRDEVAVQTADILRQPDFEAYRQAGAGSQSPMASMDKKALRSVAGGYGLHGDDALYPQMTADEAAAYQYLLAKEGDAAAVDYFERLKTTLNERRMQKTVDASAAAARGELPEGIEQGAEWGLARNLPYKGLAQLGSVGASLAKGAGYLYAGAQGIAGNDIDQNSQWFTPSVASSTIRGQTAQDIEQSLGGWTGSAASFLYQTGMSIADFLLVAGVTSGLGGAASAAASGILALGAATDTTHSALSRGATDGQALAMGFWAGAAEAVFEKVSIDHFIKLASPAARHALVKNALKQAGIEASEELATEIAGKISDALVMGDLSEYNLAIQDYVSQGMSKDEAQRLASQGVAVDIVLAGLGGALSGGVIGSVGGASSRLQTVNAGRQVSRAGNARALVEMGLEHAEGTLARTYAQENMALLEEGKALSSSALGRQYVANLEAGSRQAELEAVMRPRAQEAQEDAKTAPQEAMQTPQAIAEDEAQTPMPEWAEDEATYDDTDARAEAQPAEVFAQADAREDAQANQRFEEMQPQSAAPAEAPGEIPKGGFANDAPASLADGEAVTISHIAAVEGGEVVVVLDDGTRATLDDVSFEDARLDKLYDSAKMFDTKTARALVAAYDGQMNVNEYIIGFTTVYGAARKGMSTEAAAQASAYASAMPEGARQMAYQAGVNVGHKAPAAQTTAQAARKGSTKGLLRNHSQKAYDALGSLEQKKRAMAQFEALDAIGKKYGVLIQVVDSIAAPGGRASGVNGMFDPATGRITIALNAIGEGYMHVAVHELVHYAKQYNDSGYADLEAFVFSALEAAGEDTGALVEAQKKLIPAATKAKMSDEAMTAWAREEVVANSVPAILSDEAAVRRLVEADQTLAERIQDFFRDFMATLQDAFERLVKTKSWAQMEALQKDAEALGVMADVFESVLVEAQKKNSSNTREDQGPMSLSTRTPRDEAVLDTNISQGDTGVNNSIGKTDEKMQGEKKFSLNPDFEAQYDAWDKKNAKMRFFVGRTSEPLKSIGVKDQVIAWDGSKIKRIKEDHPNMTDNVIKQVPDILERPVVVMQSKSSEQRITLFGEVYDSSGTPVLAVLELLPTSQDQVVLDMIKIASAYGKEGNIKNFLKSSEILYVEPNKNRTDRWLKRNRLYLPFRVNDGSIGRISYPISTVKSQDAAKANQDGSTVSIRAGTEEMQGEKKFSLKDTSAVDVQTLAEENVDMDRAIDSVGKKIHKLTGKGKLQRTAIERLAKQVLKQTQSKYDAVTLADNLEAIFEYIATAQPDWRVIREEGIGLAMRILELSEQVDDTNYNQYKDLRQQLRQTPIMLTQTQRQEAEALYDGYNRYRQKLFGKVNLKNDGIPLDVQWQELSAQYPELFPADISEGDMVPALEEAVGAIQKQYVNPYGYNMQAAAQDLFGQLYQAYFDIPEVKTMAEANADELARYKAELAIAARENRRKSKEAYEKKLARLKQENDAKIQELEEKDRKARRWLRYDLAAEYRQKAEKLRAKGNERLMKQRAENQDKVRRQRQQRAERETVTRYRTRIERNTKNMVDWLLKPTNDKYVPEQMRNIVLGFLKTVDFAGEKTTITANEWRVKMGKLKNLAPANDQEMGVLPELDPDFVKKLEGFEESVKGVAVVAELDVQQLKVLDELVTSMKRAITMANKLHANERYETVTALGDAAIKEMEQRKKTANWWPLQSFLHSGMIDSLTFFNKLGPAGMSVYGGLRRGLDKQLTALRQTKKFTDTMWKREGVSARERKKWTTEKRTYRVAGGAIEVTDAQIMNLYVLNKRAQARGHIFGGGIKLKSDVKWHKMKWNTEGGKLRLEQTLEKVGENKPYQLTPADVEMLTGHLSDMQKRVADTMQGYLTKEEAEWGNEVTMELYGMRKYGGGGPYWPIDVDPAFKKGEAIQKSYGQSAHAVRNASHTKNTVENAANPIVLGDAFEVFARHTTEMAAYRGLAVPLTDAMKWYNHQTVTEAGTWESVSQSIDNVAGKNGKGTQYFLDFMLALNGAEVTPYETGIESAMMSAAKLAGIGANLRVVIQQPTAYWRARAVIEWRYLSKALKEKVTPEDIELAEKYAPIVWLKSQGFYQTSMGPSMYQMFTGIQGVGTAIKEGSMALAGWADEVTWGKLWKAAVSKTQEMRPDLQYGSDAFYQEAGKLLSRAVDETQVVDTVFHRSRLMRSKGTAKFYTAFMAEPTKTWNMWYRAVDELYNDPKSPEKQKKLGVVFFSTAAAAINTALFAAIMDAFRDEDEAKSWLEKYLGAAGENALENINPLYQMPYFKEVMSLVEGYRSSRMDLQALERAVNIIGAWQKYLAGESSWTMYRLMYETAAAASRLSGVPVGNAWRDLHAVGGTVARAVGADWWPKLKPTKETLEMRYMALYEAISEGDSKTAAALRKQLLVSKKPADIDTGIARAMSGVDTSVAKDYVKAIDAGDTLTAAKLRAILMQEAQADIDTGIARAMSGVEVRIAKAYAARKASDIATLRAVRNELIAEGFTGEIVDKAINLYQNMIEAEKPDEKKDKELTAKLYGYGDLHAAIRKAVEGRGGNGSIADIHEELLKDSSAKDPERTINSTVASEFRDEYLGYIELGEDGKAKTLAALLERFGVTEKDLTGWRMERATDELRMAVDAEQTADARAYVIKLKRLGREHSAIASGLTSRYKPMYKTYMKEGDRQSAQAIAKTLMALGLHRADGSPYYSVETFAEWMKGG